MNPINDSKNDITDPIKQANALNKVIPGNVVNPLNQVKNVINPTDSALDSLINLNKNESDDKVNTLKSAYNLGLVNNQKNPNQNNEFLSDKAYNIEYTP